VQWDTSDHDWLEGRGERIYLIGMIDDATSRALARLARQDSTAENMRLLWGWLEKHGRFIDEYTDRAGLFETVSNLPADWQSALLVRALSCRGRQTILSPIP
jgi:hypothetical protein